MTYDPGSTGRAVLPRGRARDGAAGRRARSEGREDQPRPSVDAAWAAASGAADPHRARLDRGAAALPVRRRWTLLIPRPADDAAGSPAAPDGRPSRPGEPAAVAGAYFAELPVDAITPEPAAAATGLRRGGDGRAGALDPRGRPAPAGRRPPRRATDRYELVMGERRWRAAQAGRARQRSRRSSGTPTTTRCCATRCWRTCTASQLNPLEEAAAYQQLLEDFGCTHDELAGRIGRSRPQISQHAAAAASCRRRCSAGSPPACCPPATPGAARPRRRRGARTGWPSGSSPRASRCAALEEIVARRRRTGTPAARGRAHASRSPPGSTTSPTGSPTGSRPGSRSTSAGARARSPSSSPRVDDLERIVALMAPDSDLGGSTVG